MLLCLQLKSSYPFPSSRGNFEGGVHTWCLLRWLPVLLWSLPRWWVGVESYLRGPMWSPVREQGRCKLWRGGSCWTSFFGIPIAAGCVLLWFCKGEEEWGFPAAPCLPQPSLPIKLGSIRFCSRAFKRCDRTCVWLSPWDFCRWQTCLHAEEGEEEPRA